MYSEFNRGGGWPPPINAQHFRRDSGAWVEDGSPNWNDVVHYSTMKSQLSFLGVDIDSLSTIMDFGCRAGRIIRHFDYLEKEVWGVDKYAPVIHWCRENLDHSLNFLVAPSQPHLPFRDGYFDFIYAFSVFTHIGRDYLFWLLELRRVLKDDGVLYVTIHDENSLVSPDHPPNVISSINKLKNSLKEDYIILYDGKNSFFQKRHFLLEVSKYFNVRDYIERGYGYQSVLILSPDQCQPMQKTKFLL